MSKWYSPYDKNWANDMLRYSISCLKYNQFLCPPPVMVSFVKGNIDDVEHYGFWWQGKQIRKWLSRFMLRNRHCIEDGCDNCDKVCPPRDAGL